MDFQKYVDAFYQMTIIISVEKKPDSEYGEIRIVAANKKYIEFIEKPLNSVSRLKFANEKTFVPNSLYSDYIQKNPNFEELCYQAAVMKEPVHTYVHPNMQDMWLNVLAIPIDHEDDKHCYCAYSIKLTETSSIDPSSTHSRNVSEDVLRTCLKLHGAKDFRSTLSEVISDIRLLCGAEVCTIMLVDFGTATCSVLAKSVMPNSTLKTVTQFVNFYDIAISWLDTMGSNDCIIIKSEKDMEYIKEINNPWWLTLDEAGVDSVVMFPLQYNGEVLGFIWATNFNTCNAMKIKETLELSTFFISSQLANYNMVRRLERVSYTDILTGVQNRNAMNNRISSVVSGNEFLLVPFGVVFADLNGLKYMNDTQGHSAGDILLKKAAILLQEIFKNDEIYRAGGDEFVVLETNCKLDEFNKKVEELRKRADTPQNVSIAVGSYYVSSGCDIRDAMRLADENMYKDKEEYYAKHPKTDRRRTANG